MRRLEFRTPDSFVPRLITEGRVVTVVLLPLLSKSKRTSHQSSSRHQTVSSRGLVLPNFGSSPEVPSTVIPFGRPVSPVTFSVGVRPLSFVVLL